MQSSTLRLELVGGDQAYTFRKRPTSESGLLHFGRVELAGGPQFGYELRDLLDLLSTVQTTVPEVHTVSNAMRQAHGTKRKQRQLRDRFDPAEWKSGDATLRHIASTDIANWRSKPASRAE